MNEAHYHDHHGAAPVDSIEVLKLQRGEEACWDAFVEVCPEATFFHRVGWRAVIERAFGHRTHFIYARSRGAIVGVLPLAEVRSVLFGNSLVSLPFCVYGGIAALTDGARTALDRAAQELASDLRVGHLEYRQLAPLHADWPRSEVYVTFRKPIAVDVEANLLSIPRKQRAMVRKAMKNGLVSEVDTDIERFYTLYADNVRRHGTPALPKRYFALLREIFGDTCEVQLTHYKGRDVSGVVSFYFRDEVLPYYAGDIPAARELAANDFKYWELMRRACERGCRVFDYGRSKRGTGTFDFKRNWGFEPSPLHYEYKLVTADHVPENNPLNPKYRLMIATWKQLPLWLANRLGPLVAGSLG